MRTDLLGLVRLQWDRVVALGCVLAGVITLLLGWVGVSNTVFTARQLPYIAGCGLGGIFLLGLGAMLWLSADLRDEWRLLERIEKALLDSGTALPGGSAEQARSEPATQPQDVTRAQDVTGRGAAVAAGRHS